MAHLIYLKETPEPLRMTCTALVNAFICICVSKYVSDYLKLHNGAQKVWELHYPESQSREETLLTAAWIFQMQRRVSAHVENQRAHPRTPDPNLPTAPSTCPGHSGRPEPSRYRHMGWALGSEATNRMCIFSSRKFSCNNLQPQTRKHLRDPSVWY